MRELLAWHSHVLTVTSPSPQWGNRLNLMAANASDASRQFDSKTTAMNSLLTSTPQFLLRRALDGAQTRYMEWHRLRKDAADCQC